MCFRTHTCELLICHAQFNSRRDWPPCSKPSRKWENEWMEKNCNLPAFDDFPINNLSGINYFKSEFSGRCYSYHKKYIRVPSCKNKCIQSTAKSCLIPNNIKPKFKAHCPPAMRKKLLDIWLKKLHSINCQQFLNSKQYTSKFKVRWPLTSVSLKTSM